MSTIILTFPILTGKVEAWRRFCQELSGSQLQLYLSSRRRLGITRERMALVENNCGAVAVTSLEAIDIGWTLGQLISSSLPFDRWYREKVHDLHGITLTGYEQFVQTVPSSQNQELLFEWMLETAQLRKDRPSRVNRHTQEADPKPGLADKTDK